MLKDNLDSYMLEKVFLIPRFTDGIRVIWYGETETFYRFVLFVFYLLGCFQVRFYQYKIRSYLVGIEDTIRCVSFHPYIWNPISIIAEFIFQIINYVCDKDITYIHVAPMIAIDVKNNRAYIIHIKK